MNNCAIEIRELTKKYKDVTAVDNFSLDVPKGSLTALLGVNGAGKTTLIGMLSGVIRPDSGDARLLGHSITDDVTAAKRLLSVSPQESAVAAAYSFHLKMVSLRASTVSASFPGKLLKWNRRFRTEWIWFLVR